MIHNCDKYVDLHIIETTYEDCIMVTSWSKENSYLGGLILSWYGIDDFRRLSVSNI